MSLPLLVLALGTLAAAATALALRHLIHCALLLIPAWAGLGAFYLWAGAEFVAFAQILVYVGAVSMVVLFAVLLTRPSREDLRLDPVSVGRGTAGLVAAGAVFGVLAGGILSARLEVAARPAPSVTVRQIGEELAGPHAAALLIVGLILTVALLGAVIIAAGDSRDGKEDAS